MSFIDRILSILAPHDCLSCGAEGALLCRTCLAALPSATPKRLDGSDLVLVYSATIYSGVAKDLTWKLKSSGAQEASRIMASVMLRSLPVSNNLLIVPVPTATTRVRQRGYDQARLLAREISRQTGLPYANCLIRTGQAHQVGSDRKQRLHQLTKALRIKNMRLIVDQNIVLVDDVVTTGATLESAATILKQAGAQQISAITFAQPQLRIKRLSSRVL